VILADSSAWIEFLRRTGSPTNHAMRSLLEGDLAVTEPVAMEVLAGARDERHLRELRALLGRAHLIPCTSADFFEAAALHRACRQSGETVRRLVDCLIAAVAIRAGVPVLHNDGDYDVLARHTTLSIHPATG
jgi:predicted nucleic acid-binding protein